MKNSIQLLLTLLIFLSLGYTAHTQCLAGDCQSGQGTYQFKNKSASFTGNFAQSKPEGFGICKYANGDQYEGNWKKGMFAGTGVLTKKNGAIIKGLWENGKLIATDLQTGIVSDHKQQAKNENTVVGKTWALVVGVAAYEHMPALRYADDDAWLFYSNLIANSSDGLNDGEIKILIDEAATRNNILAGLKTMANQAGPNDLLLFYFSGHGYEGSFLPIDYDGFSNKLFHAEINKILAQTTAKQKICIADACHSGSLYAAKGKTASNFLNLYTDLTNDHSGTALMLSSKSKETSLESNGLRHGVFTYFLVKGLKGAADKNEDGTIILQELFDFIYAEVRAYTGKMQSPLLSGDFDPNFPLRAVPHN